MSKPIQLRLFESLDGEGNADDFHFVTLAIRPPKSAEGNVALGTGGVEILFQDFVNFAL